MYSFPFGMPIEARQPLANPGGLFILGAYPSALHVRWRPPEGKGIAALAVDNEPTPFWDGADEADRIESWKESVAFDAAYGTVSTAGSLNGPSGAWVRDQVLHQFSADIGSAWITDCLDTYCGSNDQAAGLTDRFNPFAVRVGLPIPSLPPHPSEGQIVAEALDAHRSRLHAELVAARPTTIITLGNAAMRVLRELVEWEHDPGSAIGATTKTYGRAVDVCIDDHSSRWFALCHPASPRRYQALHAQWAP